MIIHCQLGYVERYEDITPSFIDINTNAKYHHILPTYNHTVHLNEGVRVCFFLIYVYLMINVHFGFKDGDDLEYAFITNTKSFLLRYVI